MDAPQGNVQITAPDGQLIDLPLYIVGYCTGCRSEQSMHVILCRERLPGRQEYNKGVVTAECRNCWMENTLSRWRV